MFAQHLTRDIPRETYILREMLCGLYPSSVFISEASKKGTFKVKSSKHEGNLQGPQETARRDPSVLLSVPTSQQEGNLQGPKEGPFSSVESP